MSDIVMAAGEESGVRLGGALAAELLRRRPDLRIAGLGGGAMEEAGVEVFAPCGALSVMGYWDAAARLPAVLSLRRRLLSEIRRRRPRLFIGIDAPDFNLTVAPAAREFGAKAAQYTAPSVWMWRRGRAERIRRAVDEVWCLLPFGVISGQPRFGIADAFAVICGGYAEDGKGGAAFFCGGGG